jgi:ATP-dependent exoDNAse (exonuclease V) alpha subunit
MAWVPFRSSNRNLRRFSHFLPTSRHDPNDYEKEVFNGDLGLVRAVDAEAGELLVDFDGRAVAYDFGELDALVLAYATTVHKAQGSEYPAVVLPVTTQHWPMLVRNLLYTGVTRGRRLVVLMAQPKAVAIAVKGQPERRRWSKLKEWLSAEPDGGSHAAAAGGLAFPISDAGRLSQSRRE